MSSTTIERDAPPEVIEVLDDIESVTEAIPTSSCGDHDDLGARAREDGMEPASAGHAARAEIRAASSRGGGGRR